jgi:hypothetical protein
LAGGSQRFLPFRDPYGAPSLDESKPTVAGGPPVMREPLVHAARSSFAEVARLWAQAAAEVPDLCVRAGGNPRCVAELRSDAKRALSVEESNTRATPGVWGGVAIARSVAVQVNSRTHVLMKRMRGFETLRTTKQALPNQGGRGALRGQLAGTLKASNHTGTASLFFSVSQQRRRKLRGVGARPSGGQPGGV